MWMNINEILVKMIKKIDLFKQLNDNECLELSNNFELKYYPKWSTIIKEWFKPTKIYILNIWSLQVKKYSTNSILWNINPWEIFWEMSYLNDTKAMWTVFSTQDSDIWEMDIESFDEFLQNHISIKEKIFTIAREREEKNKNSNFKFINNFEETDWEILNQ